ncbi:MAG: HAMP domain-containing histidine kinase [Actinomycetota bacterium]|nr:HAMP domain-containing histidine kinase [Actinomycetota bacterium]
MPTRFQPSIKFRLTFLYGALFLLAGALLLAFNYFLVYRSITDPEQRQQRVESILDESLNTPAGPLSHSEELIDGRPAQEVFEQAHREFASHATRELLTQSLVALSGMAVAAMALGWIAAGRVLRPLKDITATARRLSEQNLHERIAMQGPHDELRELADTLDDMLGRLEAAFDSQRRFVSNASHELLTPLAIMRAELDVTLTDENVSNADLLAMAETIRAATLRSEKLIERLLALARSNQGVTTRSRVRLDDVVRDAVVQLQPLAERAAVHVESDLREAPVKGDRVLLERLVANLVENAIVHNRPGGEALIRTHAANGQPTLQVDNDGKALDPEAVENLFEPFARAGGDRLEHREGFGLGLSIVRSVAEAHSATVDATPRPGGGLSVTVAFPNT